MLEENFFSKNDFKIKTFLLNNHHQNNSMLRNFLIFSQMYKNMISSSI